MKIMANKSLERRALILKLSGTSKDLEIHSKISTKTGDKLTLKIGTKESEASASFLGVIELEDKTFLITTKSRDIAFYGKKLQTSDFNFTWLNPIHLEHINTYEIIKDTTGEVSDIRKVGDAGEVTP